MTGSWLGSLDAVGDRDRERRVLDCDERRAGDLGRVVDDVDVDRRARLVPRHAVGRDRLERVVPTSFAALKAKSPRAASATVTLEPGVVGCAPTDHVSGSPSASMALTCTIVDDVLGRRDRLRAAMTGAVVPWSRPTTCTSWVPRLRRVREGHDGRRQRAERRWDRSRRSPAEAADAGSPSGCRWPARSRDCPRPRRSSRRPAAAPPRPSSRSTTPGARGIPQVRDVDAPAGGRGQPRSELVAGVVGIDLLRRPERRAAVHRHRSERAHGISGRSAPGHGHAPSGGHDARRRQPAAADVADDGARAHEARRSAAPQ